MEIVLPPEWPADWPALPTDRTLSADEFLRLPEGPPHFELIDGELQLNASPRLSHAIVAGNLHLALAKAAPDHLRVISQPLDWVADDHNVLEPDLQVLVKDPDAPLGVRDLPLLVVEILSPSARRDLNVKRAIFEGSGVAACWFVDPERLHLTALVLDGDTYRTDAQLDGTGTYRTDAPFPIEIDVADLGH